MKKKQKEQEKQKKKMFSLEVAKCHDNYIFVVTRPQEDTRRNVAKIGTLSRQILRRLLQKAKKLLSQHFTALSQQKVENSPWKTTEDYRDFPNLCHDTIQVKRQKKFVTTFCNFIVTKNKANGSKTLSQQ